MHDAFAHCERLVREGDKDRFVAGLFAPAALRPGLYALYAFNLEIARVAEAVREPLAGQMRLQWWIDALTGEGHGAVGAHPVAAALQETVARHALPVPLLVDLIEARFFDLTDDAPETVDALEFYLRRTATALTLLAARVLGDAGAPALAECAAQGGIAYGLSALLRALPRHAARGKLYLPLDLMRAHGLDPHDVLAGTATPALAAVVGALRQRAQTHLAALRTPLRDLPPETLPALLPLAPVPGLLGRLARAGDDPFRLRDLPAWRRQWAIWSAARNGELSRAWSPHSRRGRDRSRSP